MKGGDGFNDFSRTRRQVYRHNLPCPSLLQSVTPEGTIGGWPHTDG